MKLTAFAAAHIRAITHHPIRYWRLLFRVLLGEHSRLKDRLRTLCHFAEGVAAARVVKTMNVDHIHAHWAVGSATCAMVVSDLHGIPFTFTAHAYDIWRDKLIIPQKLAAARSIITCTGYNRTHLIETYGVEADKVRVVYHGLDLDRFRPLRSKANPHPILLSVGRLVEQKGFACLLHACAALVEQGMDFQCEIVGDGPLRQDLETLAEQLGLTERVRLRGRLSQEQLLHYYGKADVFALACLTASDNDRDGIPNTLIEALAMELPVVSTCFSGIPELVRDGKEGFLVAPGSVPALTGALRLLLSDPERCRLMGRTGRQRVVEHFSLRRSAETLDRIFSNLL